ncbi:nicotinate (nicotinamide) nucleotide adenylyltransferase [Algibacillus agarilyticus]|uniref:nicotinate (nicotinamide) nucleotide adenylyltransferase n=1 Tax=Algibacillus agarilyticus TaxID=2234133 RepID=UPI000DD001DC|nr:nicotinate (nicotinamide) nucleotide adenylyltransferase [Algibacillus agarilyticus]
MLTGLYFGSFNPIHIGHLAVANYMLEFTDLDEIWFVVSPQTPLKKKHSLLNDQFRLKMVKLAMSQDPRFSVSDVEFEMPKPSYTSDTLTHLSKHHPDRQFVLVMGADGLSTFPGWKKFEFIQDKYTRYVYPRFEDDIETYKEQKNIKFVQAPKMEISSSFIRDGIKSGKDIRHFLPSKVYDFIQTKGFYL